MYLYVKKDNKVLHDKLYKGFQLAIADGFFDKLFLNNQMIKDALQKTIDEATNASVALIDIQTTIDEISGMNAQIATASEEQNAVATNVSENVTQIFNITNEVSENAQGARGASEKLGELGEGLISNLSKFKI